jgi:hypothetical protein
VSDQEQRPQNQSVEEGQRGAVAKGAKGTLSGFPLPLNVASGQPLGQAAPNTPVTGPQDQAAQSTQAPATPQQTGGD